MYIVITAALGLRPGAPNGASERGRSVPFSI
jgi:hypothetical protein